MIDWPSTGDRLAPAATSLMERVTAGQLVHDGDRRITEQMLRVAAKPTAKGWTIASADPKPIVAAQAAMLAVHRAMTARRPVVHRVQNLR
jgi:hypothetical protein